MLAKTPNVVTVVGITVAILAPAFNRAGGRSGDGRDPGPRRGSAAGPCGRPSRKSSEDRIT